jgi:hypothetical protein
MSVLLSRIVILEIVNALTGALVSNQLPVAANLADVDFLARRPVGVGTVIPHRDKLASLVRRSFASVTRR